MNALNNKTVRCCGVILCLIGILTFALSQTLYSAAEETSGRTLTLVCKTDEASLSGVDFSIYLVGERDSASSFAMNPDFSQCMTVLDDFETSAVEAAALSLAAYAEENEVVCTASGTSDENAELVIADLADGLYLIVGAQTESGDKLYTPTPVLIEISDDTAELISYTKFTVSDVSSVSSESENSSEVSSYEDSSSDESEGDSDSDNSRDTDSGGNTPTDSTASDSGDDSSSVTTSTDTSSTENVPQTGQLWWPVPILILVGITLIGFGLKAASKKDND